MKQPLVSIILPTYNVERFLKYCLDSLEVQTYSNIEVIIIIDGATDSSFEIAKEYCSTHPRFAVYWQDNQGSGPARNNGLSHATGELVMFVDPDDWCEPTYVEELVTAQQQGDFDLTISRDRVVHYEGDGTINEIKTTPLTPSSVIDLKKVRQDYVSLLEKNLVRAPHGKLYKKSVIDENSIAFPAMRRSQDIAFNYLYYTHVKSYCTCSVSGYTYRIIMNEKRSKLKPEYSETISALYEGIMNMYENWGVNLEKYRVANFLFSVLYGYFCFLRGNASFVKSKMCEGKIHNIVETARPDRADRVFVRHLLLHERYFLSSLYFKLVSLIYK